VQAILESESTFPTSDIDIFACGSTMGNLMRFARSTGKTFRFSIEVVGNTLFFIRKENDPREVIKDVRGFGHSFPEAYTAWEKEVKGSESHQRMVQYTFGGFTCLMRFECDGYLRDSSIIRETQDSNKTSDAGELSQAFEAAFVSQTVPDMEDVLEIKAGGCEVPQSSIFDLKTRSGRYKTEIDMSDFLPVLWLKQIPNFIVAYHDGAGLFRDIRVQDIRHELRTWEEENKEAIKRLVLLLQKITEIAKRDERGLLDVYCPSDRLEIRRQYGDGSYSMPHSLRAEWEGSAKEADNVSSPDESIDTLVESGGVKLSGQGGYDFSYDSDYDSEDGDKDFTACSVDSCGYCGTCSY